MVKLMTTAQILPNQPMTNILSLCFSYDLYGSEP